MKSKAKVVVLGGGVVGVSALYHLAKKGWSDVVLVERKELTSGSTWHAAGLLPLFNMSYSVGQLHKYAVDLYKKLEEETGKNVGFSVVSNIRLASTKDRMDEYHQYAGVAKTIGVDVKFLTPKQVMKKGALDPVVKELIYVAVSVTNGCEYCIKSHSIAAKKKGATDEMLNEMIAVVGMANETNRLVEGYQVEVDKFLK